MKTVVIFVCLVGIASIVLPMILGILTGILESIKKKDDERR